MRRLGALLLFAALTLPYARAPLCQVGSHEHQHEHQHVMYDVTAESVTSGANEMSCHELMQCQVSPDVVVLELDLAATELAEPRDDVLWSVSRPLDVDRTPDVPPPQTV
ncbi:MAG: hypothetical protein AAF389_00840 [Gemmatimonadota bacterium]